MPSHRTLLNRCRSIRRHLADAAHRYSTDVTARNAAGADHHWKRMTDLRARLVQAEADLRASTASQARAADVLDAELVARLEGAA